MARNNGLAPTPAERTMMKTYATLNKKVFDKAIADGRFTQSKKNASKKQPILNAQEAKTIKSNVGKIKEIRKTARARYLKSKKS